MFIITLLLLLLTPITGCVYSDTCVSEGLLGVCVSLSSGCCTHGHVTDGLCPGSEDIKCCTESVCVAPEGEGECMQVSACPYESYSGYCTGPTELQCCVNSSNNTDVEFGDSPYYYDHWCNAEAYALPYLDDKYCAKKFPSVYDREWSCPVVYDDSQLEGFTTDIDLSAVDVDTDILSSIVSEEEANICIIVTRRVNSVVHNKYFCNGKDSTSVPFETWSSSKIFAMANAGGHLREQCFDAGLDASTTGNHGKTPLGDLATVVCSYDTTMGYSSNGLSSYFNDVGGRQRELYIATDWIGEPNNSLGGNYGESTPSDLGFTMTCSDGETCPLNPDSGPAYYNSLSSLSAAELTRRLVLHRDMEEQYKFPNLTWTDAQTIMYGADSTELFPSVQWGGMTTDPSIYVQSSLNISAVQEQSAGQWRVFSKLGAGYSTSRQRGEIINNAYACLPLLDENEAPIVNAGLEFTLSVRGSVPYDTTLSKAEDRVYNAVSKTLAALVDGKLV